jgi:carboxyl-terminal processing protease
VTKPPQTPGETGSGPALFVLGLAAGLLAALAVDRVARFYFDREIELVRTVRNLAADEFVDPVDSGTLVDLALEGMLSSLDRYSHFYGPTEIAALERETSGEFLGLGVVFRKEEIGRVLFPYPDSPAAKAGLRVGDRILRAGGTELRQHAVDELAGLLRAETGELELEVEDLEGSLREVKLRPEVVLDPTVRHVRMLEPERGLGYLAIRSFSHHTPKEFDGAVSGLTGLKALVLDLRGNPGGILDSAVQIANRFVVEGVLVATRARTETRRTEADPEKARLAGIPLVVLLDGYTASASEVLAACLQDHALAVLVGEPSYGKGTVQTLKHVGDDRAIAKLTTAHYCSPSMRRIEHDDGDAVHSGIAPDLWVPLADAEQREVYRFLASYSPPASALAALHAWEKRTGQRLVEDPPSDRQLDAAVALLDGVSLELFGDELE